MRINKLDKKVLTKFWQTDFNHFFVKITEIISNINRIFDSKKPITLEDGSTITWDYQDGYNSVVTLGGNRTLVISNLEPGDYGTIKIIQDNVGSRTLALSSNSIVMGTGGTDVLGLTTTASVFDVASFYYDGTTIIWNLSTY